MTGPFDTPGAAYLAAGELPDPPHYPGHNKRLIMAACADAGLMLGVYDHHVIEWLSNGEPSMCAVVAGLISRANQPAAGVPGAGGDARTDRDGPA